jgi:mono/diheme cytochrome c family protein
MLMKKFLIITGCIAAIAFTNSCGSRQSPGRSYMPDMTYSRAYETYAPAQERLNTEGGTTLSPVYNGKPVEGTMARGDYPHYELKNDSAGYAMSAGIKSPLDPTTVDLKESERLYLVNCGICHGPKLDGNGPLYKGGDGPFGAKPATLVGDAKYEAMPEGTMFHSVTYGKGAMGSYASQLSTKQRWMVIAYVKSKQNKGGSANAATPDSSATKAPVTTTTAMSKPDSAKGK